MKEVEMPDNCQEVEIAMLEVKLCKKNQDLSVIEFDEEKTEISIGDSGLINFKMLGKKAVFNMDFDINSEPQWIQDHGKGMVTLENFMIYLNISVSSLNGKIQFEFKDAHMDVDKFDGKFDGETEIIQSIQLVI